MYGFDECYLVESTNIAGKASFNRPVYVGDCDGIKMCNFTIIAVVVGGSVASITIAGDVSSCFAFSDHFILSICIYFFHHFTALSLCM